MCLTCGCLQAHTEMTDDDIAFEDVQRAADQNGVTVEQVLETIGKTIAVDRRDHPAEYASTDKA